ncbi:4407_t:CDS:2, partial [Diversispora eburnea]
NSVILYGMDEEKSPISIEIEEDSKNDKEPKDIQPTSKEWKSLRKVSDKIPIAVWFVVVCELCERFTYYGVSGPFQNYVQFPERTEVDGQAGAIGAGQQVATSLSYFFQFFCYITPIFGAILADKYFGRYKTILIFSLIYVLGLIILTVTAIPPAIKAHYSLPGLIVAMVIIGLGTGGIKPNVSPLSADQYTKTQAFIKILKSGERVIVDPQITLQSIFHYFYLAINVGSLSVILTTNFEKYFSYWLTYLIPLIMFMIAIFVLIFGRHKYVKKPPEGSAIFDFSYVIWIAFINGRDLENAKPSNMSKEELQKRNITWNDEFVDQSRDGLRAIKAFAFFPFYWVAYNQMYNNLVSQAATMDVGSIPNDIMYNIDTITVIILTPFANSILYPVLQRFGINLGFLIKFLWGFIFVSAAMFYSAYVQQIIYNASPGLISVWVQTPAFVLIGLSEVLLGITALNYSYYMAPDPLKSTITAVYLTAIGFGNLIGLAIVPIAKDPYLVHMYLALGIISIIAGFSLYWFFGDIDDKMNQRK